MKIIKQPQFNPCACKVCGTVFQPDADDVDYHLVPTGEPPIIVTHCPICKRGCNVSVKKEQVSTPEVCVSCGEVIPEGQQVCPICLEERSNR